MGGRGGRGGGVEDALSQNGNLVLRREHRVGVQVSMSADRQLVRRQSAGNLPL